MMTWRAGHAPTPETERLRRDYFRAGLGDGVCIKPSCGRLYRELVTGSVAWLELIASMTASASVG